MIHDSGLCAAPPERKREFARDIRNLTLLALHLNRNLKGAKDAADWTLGENRCWFAWRVIDVRRASPAKGKTKTFLIGKELKTQDLYHTYSAGIDP